MLKIIFHTGRTYERILLTTRLLIYWDVVSTYIKLLFSTATKIDTWSSKKGFRDKTSSVELYILHPSLSLFFFYPARNKLLLAVTSNSVMRYIIQQSFLPWFLFIIFFLKCVISTQIHYVQAMYKWQILHIRVQVTRILDFSRHEKNIAEELNESMAQLKPWICYFSINTQLFLISK